MLAKIDAILEPFVRWTIIILGGGFAIFLYGARIPDPGTKNAEEIFREVQAELDAQRELTPQSTKAASAEVSFRDQGD